MNISSLLFMKLEVQNQTLIGKLFFIILLRDRGSSLYDNTGKEIIIIFPMNISMCSCSNLAQHW